MDYERLANEIEKIIEFIKDKSLELLENTYVITLYIKMKNDGLNIMIYKNLTKIHEFDIGKDYDGRIIDNMIKICTKYERRLLRYIRRELNNLLEKEFNQKNLISIEYYSDSIILFSKKVYYISINMKDIPLNILDEITNKIPIERLHKVIELFTSVLLTEGSPTKIYTTPIRKDDLENFIEDIKKELYKLI